MVRTAVVPLGRNLENDQWTPQRRTSEERLNAISGLLIARHDIPAVGDASSEAARLGKEFLVQIRQWEKSKNKIKVSVLHGQTVLGFGKGPIRGFRCPTEPFQHASATRRYPG